MAVTQALVLLASIFIVSGQRPSFAGSRPIGFPELLNRTTTTPSGLEDKFGEVTTQRLPIEAQGDRELVDRLSKLPIDKQPFWFINWQALEAERQKPQTYPQRPNQFLESNFQNTNTVPQTQNTNPGTNLNPVNTNLGSAVPSKFNSGSGVHTLNWKIQDPVYTKDQDINNKNGNPNIPNEVNILVFTTNFVTTKCNPCINTPVTTKSYIPHPGLVSPEENEFEDIQVRKLVKNH